MNNFLHALHCKQSNANAASASFFANTTYNTVSKPAISTNHTTILNSFTMQPVSLSATAPTCLVSFNQPTAAFTKSRTFFASLLLGVLLFFGMGQTANAQLLQWNTFGNSGNETTEPSVANNANVGTSNLTLGSGVTAAGNSNRFGGSGWFNTGNTATGNTLAQAIAGNDYLEFIVTPNAGFSFTPTSFNFGWDRSNTGPTTLTLRSSADNFATNIGTVTVPAAISSQAITISGLTNLPTTIFRLYGYGATASGGSGGFDVASNIVNVVLNGTTCPTTTAGSVSGTSPLCINQTAQYASTGTANGTWSSSDPLVATVNSTSGFVTALAAGTAVITYTVTGGCTSPVSASKTLTVDPNANAGAVSGTSPLCIGGTATYTSTGDAGGAWSSSDPNVATVDALSGLVTAVTAGTTNIIYTVSSGCNVPVTALQALTVNPNANAGTVSGTSPLCIGGTATYTSTGETGGAWSSSNTTTASVDALSGLVTALAGGTTNIIYTISSGCNVPISAFQELVVPTIVANVTGTNPTSIGANDGTATAAPTGGASLYTYLWSPGGETTATITGLMAGTYTVTITDANSCMKTGSVTLADPFTVHNITRDIDYGTIQEAVTAANPGDTIVADAATYNENVTIDKSLVVSGANVGVTGNSSMRLSESILNGTFSISSSNVTIDGFKIIGAGQAIRSLGTGLISNVQLKDNFITSKTSIGILHGFGSVTNPTGSNWTISNNLIDNFQGNNLTAIVVAQITNLTISGNEINHTTSSGRRGINLLSNENLILDSNKINMGLVNPSNSSADFNAAGFSIILSTNNQLPSKNLTISSNILKGSYDGIVSLGDGNYEDIIIKNNEINNVVLGIRTQGGTNTPVGLHKNINIANNNIVASLNAIRFQSGLANSGTADPYTNIDVLNNSLLLSGLGFALQLETGSIVPDAPIDAEYNWFGSTDPAVVATRVSAPGLSSARSMSTNDQSLPFYSFNSDRTAIVGTWVEGSSSKSTSNSTARANAPTTQIDYIPYLTSGVDDDLVTRGFQSAAAAAALDCATATISYANTPFSKGSTSEVVTLSGTNDFTGGTYSATPTGLSIDPTTGTINPSLSRTGIDFVVTYSKTFMDGCEAIAATDTVFVTPATFSVTATVENGSTATTTNGTPSSITLTFCQGESFTYTNYSSIPASGINISNRYTSSANATYNGAPVGTLAPIDVAAPAGLAAFFASTYGAYGTNDGLAGTITQIFTPYFDVNNNGMLDAGDDAGAEITMNFVIKAAQTATVAAIESPACQNSATAPRVLFTGSGGTRPYTFSYTINGSTAQTVTTITNDTVSVAAPTAVAGTFTYAIVSVTDASDETCTQPITGQSANVVINPVSTATVTGPTAVCQSSTGDEVTFTAAGGTGQYTFSYNIDGGTTLTASSSATDTTDRTATVAIPTGTAGSVIFNLISVTNGFGCANPQTGSFTVTINPTPIVTATPSTQTICSNTRTNIALTASTPSTFSWTVTNVNGGILGAMAGTGTTITDSLRNPSTTASGTVTYTVTASSTAGSCPSAPITVTITVQPSFNATVIGASNTQVCTGEGASINISLNGVPNFTGSFRIREIIGAGPTFGPATFTSNFTSSITGAQAQPISGAALPNTTSNTKQFRIDFNVVTDANGCVANPTTGFVDITVNPLPVIAVTRVTTAGDVCPGTNIVFNVIETNSVGGTFNWVASDANGIITSANNVAYGPGAVNTNLGKSCPYNQAVTFTFSPVAPGPLACRGRDTIIVVNVRDIVNPVFTNAAMSLDTTISCSDMAGLTAAQAKAPTATDNCSPSVTITKAAGVFVRGTLCPNAGTITNVFTGVDACGNDTTFTQVITIVDTVAPVFTTMANALNTTLSCSDTAGLTTAQAQVPVATDNCSPFRIEKVTGAFQGNTRSCRANGTYTNTFTATDSCGNVSAIFTQVITIVDTTKPVFTTLANGLDTTLNCSDTAGLTAAQAKIPVATDNCSPFVITKVSGVFVRGTLCPNAGTITNTFTANDGCGNTSAIFTQVITIVDTTAPVFITLAMALDTTLSCSDTAGLTAAQAKIPVASDNCSPFRIEKVTGAFQGNTRSCRANGTYRNTFTATDSCGNVSAIFVQVITIEDTTAPVFTTLANALDTTISCSDADGLTAAQAKVPVATDNCSPFVITKVSGVFVRGTLCPNAGTITNTFTANDGCGNISDTFTQVITIVDTVAPVFTTMANALNTTLSCSDTAGLTTAQAQVPVATDNCSPFRIEKVTGAFQGNTRSCRANGTYTNTFTATDSCGNVSAIFTQVITIVDTTKPVFTTLANGLDTTLNCSDTAGLTAAQAKIPVATDNCSPFVITKVSGVFVRGTLCPNAGTITNTFTANDGCGNTSAIFTQVITIVDTTAPVFITLANALDTTLSCSDTAGLTAAQAKIPVASDNCSPFRIEKVTGAFQGNTRSCRANGTYRNTFTATDSCGNVSAIFVQVITIEDTTAPVFTTLANALDTTISCSDADGLTAAQAKVPVATDNCSPFVITKVSGVFVRGTLCPNAGTITNTFTANDGCGNISDTFTQVITIVDTVAPVFTTMANALNTTLSCSDTAGLTTAQAQVPVATDNCSPFRIEKVTGAFQGNTRSCRANGTYTNTFTATDSCGNVSAIFTQVITIVDTTKPVFTTLANGLDTTLNCSDTAGLTAAQAKIPVATDNCSPFVITKVSGVFVRGTLCPNAGTITNTFTANDGCGNTSAIFTQVITIVDTTAPVFITLANALDTTLSCSDTAGLTAAQAKIPVASDNCSPFLITKVTGAFVSGTTCAAAGTYTNTFTAKDSCGNTSAIFTQVITIQDTTKPVFTSSATALDTTLSCSDTMGLRLQQAKVPMATDNCSLFKITKVTGAFVPGTICAAAGTYTNTFTAKDSCGNVSAIFTQVITIVDTAGPVFTTIPTQTLNVGDSANCSKAMPDFRRLAMFTDCNAVTLVQKAPNAPGSLVIGFGGSRTIEIEGTDACGNKRSTFFTLNIVDATAPTTKCKDTTVNLDASGNVTITPAFINNGSSDRCSPVTLAIDKTTFTCDNVGPNTVKLYVTDASGNRDSCTAIVTIKDVTAPVITCFGDTTLGKDVNCTTVLPDLTFRVTKADACGFNANSVTQSIPAGTVISASITTFPITLTVTDVNGNKSMCTFNVNFADTSKPIITQCAPAQTANTPSNSCNVALPDFTATTIATDNCTGAAMLTKTQSPVAGTPIRTGVQTVTITVRDVAGNFSTCTTTFTVVDNVAPVITTCAPADSVRASDENCTASVPDFTSKVVATDNCSALSVTQSPEAGTLVTIGTTPIVLTVTDSSGNITTCTTSFIVKDSTKPIITTCAPAQTGNTDANCSALVPDFTSTVVATDACSGALNITQSPAAGTAVSNGVTNVIITVTDASGNFITCPTTFTVTDNTAPSIATCAAPDTIRANDDCEALVPDFTTSVIASDNCTATSALIITQSPAAGTIATLGITPVTITVADTSGNSTTCNTTLTVADSTAPVITVCANDTTIAANGACTALVPDFTSKVNASDNCSTALSVAQSPAAGTVAALGNTTITITVTDAASNASTCTAILTVADSTAPVITVCANDTTVAADANCMAPVPNFTGLVTATDNCTSAGPITYTQSPAAATMVGVGTIPVTIFATDAAGNIDSCTVSFTVADSTAPVITICAPNQSVRASANCTATVPNFTAGVTATDNCSSALSVSQIPAVGATVGIGVTNITLIVTDAAGNTDTCFATFTVKDSTAPVFVSCPPSITPPINKAGCVARVDTESPVVTDNCSTPSAPIKIFYTLSGAATFISDSTDVAFLGAFDFPVGVTTVTYTAKDSSGNRSTCVYTVTVNNTLMGNISGTATVMQNASNTSNITFTGSGGARPYSFTYNVSTNGGAPSANQTITTLPGNNVTTVPQSSAVVGTYTYTLVSVTDSLGCVVNYTMNNTATITVVSMLANADFTPTLDIDALSLAPGASSDFTITINEINNGPSNGQVIFRIPKSTAFPITFNPISGMSNVNGGIMNQNSDWTFTSPAGAFNVLTLKPGVVIPPSSTNVVGFRITRAASTIRNSSFNISSPIQNGSGSDTNNNNNSTTATVRAQ